MTFAWNLQALSSVLAVVFLVAATVVAWRYRWTSVGAPTTVAAGAGAVWMAFDALVVLAASFESKHLFFQMAHLPVAFLPPTFVVLGLRVASLDRYTRPRWLALYACIPFAAFLLVATNGLHGWMYPPESLSVDFRNDTLRLAPTPLYAAIMFYEMGMVLFGLVVTLPTHAQNWRHSKVDGVVGSIVIVACLAAMAIDASGTASLGGVRLAPIALGASAFIAALTLPRFRTLGVLRMERNNVIDGMSDGVVVVDMDNRLVDINTAAGRILSLDGVSASAQSIHEVFARHPDLIEFFRGAVQGRSELRLFPEQSDSGRIYDLEMIPLYDRHGEIGNRVLVLHDISDRVHAQEDLERETNHVQMLQEISVRSNEAESVQAILEESMAVLCRSAGAMAGRVLETGHGLPLAPREISWVAKGANAAALHAALEGAPGEPAPVLGRRAREEGRPVGTEDGGHEGPEADTYAMAVPVPVDGDVVAVFELVSNRPFALNEKTREVLENVGALVGRAIERRRIEDEIRTLAFRDSLTGLSNRQSFQDTLGRCLAKGRRTGESVALLFLDLDGFKKINDTLGHTAGDTLLCEVARRFSSVLREGDLVGWPRVDHTVSRLGGDEFTVLIHRIEQPDAAARVALRLIDTLATPIVVDGHELFASTSIGIAISPRDGSWPETLLSHADAAMYNAKGLGTNRYCFYSESMNRASAERLRLEGRLRGALARGEMVLAYQSLRDAKTTAVVGAEVLVRWQDPDEGTLLPDVFIPIAEETGVISDLGFWVLRTGCEQLVAWREAGLRPIRLAVNVSGRQLIDRAMPARVREILEETGCSPGLLELEITESSIMQDDEVARTNLSELHGLGVGIALDDFGTGFSSLNHLRRFPIERVKIDRSFVEDVATDPDDLAMTQAIVAMAHSLRVGVVAEGVETSEQAQVLIRCGCDELQGYLFGEPVSAADFQGCLETDKRADDPDGETP